MATTTRRTSRSQGGTGNGNGNGNGNGRRGTGRMSPSPQYATLGKEVQRFGTLRDLPIALPAKARQESCRCSTRSWPTR